MKTYARISSKDVLVPFDNLLECSVVAVVGGEAIRIDETAKRVTALKLKGFAHQF